MEHGFPKNVELYKSHRLTGVWREMKGVVNTKKLEAAIGDEHRIN